MKATRWVAPLVGLVSALTLAGCGVPPSGVIQAGEPASGMYVPGPTPVAPTAVIVYFLHDGGLRPYPRKIAAPGDFGAVVRVLFHGPIAGESKTATTELPRLKAAPEVEIGGDGGDNILSVQLPTNVPPLSHLAMLQLVCTVAHVATPSFPALAARENAARQNAAKQSAGGALAAPTPYPPRLSALTGVQVRGDGWTITQSDASCPAPPQP